MSSDQFLSLIYPAGYTKESHGAAFDESFISGLSADSLFHVIKNAFRFKPNQIHPMEYFTDDAEVIKYRLDVVEDLLYNDSLYSLLSKLQPEFEDMKELFTVDKGPENDTTAALYSITLIELYTGSINKLYAFFNKEHVKLRSAGMQAFAAKIKEIYESREYQDLIKEAGKITQSIRNVKSITIGVNLDAQLRPVEAGIVSVNTAMYRSGNIIDKILRLDFQNDPYICLAPLEVVSRGLATEQIAGFRSAVNSTLNTVLKSSIRSWQPVARAFTIAQSRFLVRLVDELRFLLGGVSLLKKLMSSGVPLCKPEVDDLEKRSFQVSGLYNPLVVLNQEKSLDGSPVRPVVLNNIQFDENGMIYILTGPNQGGKTVLAQAVGIAQMMFQLGLLVPGYSATISPVDHIFTHFPSENEINNTGRFGEECQRLMKIFDKLSRHSLMLMDETFSSTGATEAAYIAEQVLRGLQVKGCRVIFSTHLHDLARKIDELNQLAPSGSSRIDSLTAELDEDQTVQGKRSYKISRSRPQGLSFARDIAEKYGLTFENLMCSLEKRKAIHAD